MAVGDNKRKRVVDSEKLVEVSVEDNSIESRTILVSKVPSNMELQTLLMAFSRYGKIDEGPVHVPELGRYVRIVYGTVTAAKAAAASPVVSVEGKQLVIRLQKASARPSTICPKDPYKVHAEYPASLDYSFEDKFGNPWEFLTLTPVLSHASLAVVGLSSYTTHDHILFACSGAIVSEDDDKFIAITSASLVKYSSGSDTVLPPDLKIKVHLSDGMSLFGALSSYDWHFNIATITFAKSVPAAALPLLDVPLPTTSSIVFALGRHYSTGEYMASRGKVIGRLSKLDCEELCVSDCPITKCGIGGPLLDQSGRWVGMNFFDGDDTPFLPSSLLAGCLHQLNKYGKVYHPWIGLSLRALDPVPEHEVFNVTGLLVCQFANGSPCHNSGIQVGDIICEIEGVSLESVAQLARKLLLISEALHDEIECVINEVLVTRIVGGNRSTFKTSISVEEIKCSQYNRWPVPPCRLKKVLPSGIVLN